MPGHHTFYSGSTLLTPFADLVGLRVDQVNFVFCQVVSLITAAFYYRFLSPTKVSSTVRHVLPLSLGVSLCFFCFGPAIKHLLADGIGCYIILRFAPTKYVHKLVFVFAMSYLSYIHWYRVYHARNYLIDVTGPMMILTQKVTSLAFSLHDGAVKKEHELTPIQKKELVRSVPTPLEYFSYVYNFFSVLCGPMSFYSDYIAFIHGKHYEQTPVEKTTPVNNNVYKSKTSSPRPWFAVAEKLVICAACLLFTVTLAPSWPPEAALVLDYGLFSKFAYIMISLYLVRIQYYYAWVMADAINNAAGFGFNGYDSNGKPKWDLVSNIKIWEFETANNLRDSLAAWNCVTVYWLRRVAYERTSPRYRTYVTYIVSAWWHGFFPGYYATFLTGAMCTEAARMGRRYIRPYFLGSQGSKFFYDCVTFVCVRVIISYVAISFVLLHLEPTIKIYKQFYFCLHIAILVLLFVVPLVVPRKIVEVEKEKVKSM